MLKNMAVSTSHALFTLLIANPSPIATWTQYTGPPHRVEEFELRGRGWAVDGYPNELHEDLHQRFAVVNDLAQRISKVKATSAAVNLKRGRDESAEPPSKRRKPLLDVSKIHDHDTTKYPQAYTNATSRTTPSIHPVGRYSLPPPPASPISSVEDTEAYMQPEEDEESSPSPTPARPKLFDGYLKLGHPDHVVWHRPLSTRTMTT